jgi:endonuclease YncB( thermonuclease family)
MPTQQYIFRVAEVVRVTDGDTVHLRIAVGFHAEVMATVRLLGYDTPERNKGSVHEKAEARRAHAVTAEFLARTDGDLWIRTEKDPDVFGRWLGDIWLETGDTKRHLGAELRAAGLASIWPRRWREEFDAT